MLGNEIEKNAEYNSLVEQIIINVPKNETEKKVLSYLIQNPDATQKEVAAEIGISDRQVRNIKKAFKEKCHLFA